MVPLIVCLCGGVPAMPPERCEERDRITEQWELQTQIAGTRIYLAPASPSGQVEMAALLLWRGNAKLLYSDVSDYRHFSEFIPRVHASVVLEELDDRVWVYQRLAFPAPFRDRHYVMESIDSSPEPGLGEYRISWKISDRRAPPEAADAVQPVVFSGCWNIRATRKGRIDGVYRIATDPGGWFPRWVTRRAIQSYLTDLMQVLKRRLTDRES